MKPAVVYCDDMIMLDGNLTFLFEKKVKEFDLKKCVL